MANMFKPSKIVHQAAVAKQLEETQNFPSFLAKDLAKLIAGSDSDSSSSSSDSDAAKKDRTFEISFIVILKHFSKI